MKVLKLLYSNIVAQIIQSVHNTKYTEIHFSNVFLKKPFEKMQS